MRLKGEAIIEMKQLCARYGLNVSGLMDITALLIMSVMCGMTDLFLKGKNDETV